jgi:phospholipid transport system transporter-binding protein
VSTPLRIERIDAQHARVSGRLGFHEAADAAPRWREVCAENTDVTLDISGLEQVDSATLAVLLDWAAQARRIGSRLRLAGVPEDLTALAHLSGTEAMLGLAA